MKRSFLAVAFAALTLSVPGCAGAVVYAAAPPPPIRAEAYVAAPGPGFAWVAGYWGWRGGNYIWVPGRWTHPPRPRAVWVAPYWERYGGRYRFHEGRWR